MIKIMPKISIITACFNSEKYIEKTIKSVQNQTYSNIEYIIVDGASTDNTLTILNQYRDKIDFLISEKDQGIYDALNKGVKIATGDIIYFLNSDDYIYSYNSIEKVASAFAKDYSLKLVYGNVLLNDRENDWFHIYGKEFTLDDLKKGLMPHHQGTFIKKEIFSECNYFNLDYSYASDFDFIAKCYEKISKENILYLDEIIAVFRIGGMSTALSTAQNWKNEMREIVFKRFNINLFPTNQLSEFNGPYYKKWIEILLSGDCLSKLLLKKNIKSVALFGTMQTAIYLFEDLKKSNIEVKVFLDNDKKKHGKILRNASIVSPERLIDFVDEIDAILLTFEGFHKEEIQNQVKGILKGKEIPMFSWRDLLQMYN